VVMQIREEMKALARLGGMSRKFLSSMRNNKANSIDYTEILNMTKEIKEALVVGSTEIKETLVVGSTEIKETLVEFQARVIQALRKLQHGSSPP